LLKLNLNYRRKSSSFSALRWEAMAALLHSGFLKEYFQMREASILPFCITGLCLWVPAWRERHGIQQQCAGENAVSF